MSESKKGYRFAGDIEIKSLSYVTQAGQVIDIGPITKEISIFEDIFQHFIQCEVVISDATALLNSIKGNATTETIGGFNGGDVLIISYRSKSKDLPYKNHFFACHGLFDRQRIDEKLETYLISGISGEAYQCSTRRISRAYGGTDGNLISKMIESVVNEYVYNRQIKDLHRNYREVLGFRIEKDVFIRPTNGLQKIIIPNLSVPDTIDFLTKEADCENHTPFYTFYEDGEGFKFEDFNMLAQREVKETYSYTTQNIVEDPTKTESEIKPHQKIISYNVVRQTDLLENARAGLFRSRIINLDILKKQKKEVVFDYGKEFDKFNTLQQYQIPGDVTGEPLVYMMQSRTGHDSCCPLFLPENHVPKKVNQIIARRNSYRNHLFNTIMEVTIPGDSTLCVGDVIKLDIPQATTLGKSDTKRDKYLSGKYIITKVRNKFGGKTGETFTSFIECVKDTGIAI
jgi:hypothetical protein